MAWVQPRHVPARQPAIRSPLHDHVMPRLAPGPYLRTRRPRPSEKTALRVFSGFSPQGLSLGPGPLEGRALHARKEGITPTPALPLLGHQPVANPSATMRGLGSRSARISGRAERVPPRKTLSALSQGLPREALSPWLAPRGGAGSARPRGAHGPDRGMCPVG